MCALRYCAIAIDARMTMIVITIASSIIVKPRSAVRRWRISPVLELRSVERGAVVGGVDVEDVLAAPARRVGLVLIRPAPPRRRMRHRIDRHAAQEFQLAAGGVVRRGDAVYQDVEVGWIAFVL